MVTGNEIEQCKPAPDDQAGASFTELWIAVQWNATELAFYGVDAFNCIEWIQLIEQFKASDEDFSGRPGEYSAEIGIDGIAQKTGTIQ